MDKTFTLAWGEMEHAEVDDIPCSVATLTLIDDRTGEDIDSADLVVVDDAPDAADLLTSENVYTEKEDGLLRRHGIERASVTVTNPW